MTPRTALAEVYGAIQADDILAALKRAGWIVVRHDAIKLAQAHAKMEVAQEIAEGRATVTTTKLRWNNAA